LLLGLVLYGASRAIAQDIEKRELEAEMSAHAG
jgi:hypothetical protein